MHTGVDLSYLEAAWGERDRGSHRFGACSVTSPSLGCGREERDRGSHRFGAYSVASPCPTPGKSTLDTSPLPHSYRNRDLPGRTTPPDEGRCHTSGFMRWSRGASPPLGGSSARRRIKCQRHPTHASLSTCVSFTIRQDILKSLILGATGL